MKKNFVKVVLLGALAFSTTVSFIGCKDYDDDIDGVKESITATNSDLSTKATALEASIASLKSAQTDVTAAIAKATDDAEKAALQAKADAIASSLADMTAIKTDLTALISSNTSNITTLTQSAKGIEERLTSVEKGLGSIQKTLVGYTDLVETVGKLQSAMTRIEQIDNSLQTLSTEVQQALGDIAEQKKALEIQDSTIKNLETLTGTHSEELSAVQDKIKDLLANIETQKVALDKAASKDELAAVQNAVDTNKTLIEGLSANIDKINAKINTLSSFFLSMITSIIIDESSAKDIELSTYKYNGDTKIFGEGLKGEPVTFTKGQTYTTESKAILIQVSPSTADIESGMLSILKSDGENIDSYLEKTVTPYEEALTASTATRATSKGGIFAVNLKLKENYNETNFEKATKNTENSLYRFAIAAKKTETESSTERVVATPYSFTFKTSSPNPLTEITECKINETGASSADIELGSTFKVKFKGNVNIYASYITFNDYFPESYLVNWRQYYSTTKNDSLNTVKQHINNADVVWQIKAPTSNTAIGQKIYYIAHFVDFMGNPRTYSFDIKVTQEKELPKLAAINITPSSRDQYYSTSELKLSSHLATKDEDAQSLYNATYRFSGLTGVGIELLDDENNVVDNTGYLSAYVNIKSISKIKLSNINLAEIPDGGKIDGKIIFTKDGSISTIPVSISKTMPIFPENKLSVKSALYNSETKTFTVYPYTDGSSYSVDYSSMFNIDNSINDYLSFNITTTGSSASAGNTKITIPRSLVGSQAKSISANAIYNWGTIAYGGVTYSALWEKDGFNIKFKSIPEEATLTLNSPLVLKYGQDSELNDYTFENVSANWKNQKLTTGEWIRGISVKIITKENKIENEYLTPVIDLSTGVINFKSNSGVTWTSDKAVDATLVINITDVFGNTSKKDLSLQISKPE